MARTATKTQPAPTVVRKDAALGAEVRGIDLSGPLDGETVAWIKQTWAEHLVLVFPDQSLTEDQQVAFSRKFGELAVHVEPDKISARAPEIFRVSNVDEDGNRIDPESEYFRFFTVLTGRWHTDGSYKPMPSMGSILHGQVVPPEGGETWFCNMFRAYDGLPDAIKAKIEGRHMVHAQDFTRVTCPGLTPLTQAQREEVPPVTHPLVRTHGDGRRSLYVNAAVAYYVGGMGLEEGKAFHKQLMDLATRPEYVYRHRWSAGDVVMWDNRATMHRVTDYDGNKYRRAMQRTEILGTDIVH